MSPPAAEDGSSPARSPGDDARYALDLVGGIGRDVGLGVPGTRPQRKRAEIIRHELEKYLGTENVLVEEFAFAPAACLSAFR